MGNLKKEGQTNLLQQTRQDSNRTSFFKPLTYLKSSKKTQRIHLASHQLHQKKKAVLKGTAFLI